MKTTRNEILTFVLLVALGVLLRLGFQHIPNFAPVAAIALFSGYFFRSSLAAVAVPLSIMAISDLVLGGYSWVVMASVYGMLASPVLLRGWLRRRCDLRGDFAPALRSLGILISGAIGSSIAFFLVTNLAVWSVWYPRTLMGLLECYYFAAPFFRYTLAGDLIFALSVFSTYALVVRCSGALEPAERVAAQEA